MSIGVVVNYGSREILNYTESSTITLTNLLDPSQFTMSGVTVSDGVYTFATGTTGMIAQYPLPTPTANHVYYGRCQQKSSSGANPADSRFEYFQSDSTYGLMTFCNHWSTTVDDQWHIASALKTLTQIEAGLWQLRSFSVNASVAWQRKEHMIIDLTESFGSGNEPTKEWCDVNIPYFVGTKEIVVVKYGNNKITALNGDMTKTLPCVGKMMSGNVIVGSKTLTCSDKRMAGNVIINCHETIEYKLIGGRIFYDSGDNGCSYKFFDANKQEISDITISGLANAVYYTKTGSSDVDRFYVANLTVAGTYTDWCSSAMKSTTVGALGTAIGTGRTNTEHALSFSGIIMDTSCIFYWLDEQNLNSLGGCNDWYIGSKEELKALIDTGICWSELFSFLDFWSSSEVGSTGTAYCWYSDRESMGGSTKTNDKNCLAFRSF